MLASSPAVAASPVASPAAVYRRRRSSAASPPRRLVTVRARGGPEGLEGPNEARRGGGGFLAGVLLGGTVFGALGLLFAPQVSNLLLKGRDALRMPRDDERDEDSGESSLEEQRTTLNQKIAQCVVCQLKLCARTDLALSNRLNEAIEAFAQEADDTVLSSATHASNGADSPRLVELQLDVQRPGDVRTV
jgi:gas vesicle protein